METYTADKAYDDGENHYNLELRGLHSVIRLKKNVQKKKTITNRFGSIYVKLHTTSKA